MPNSAVHYVDATSLYVSSALRHALPDGNYKWISPEHSERRFKAVQSFKGLAGQWEKFGRLLQLASKRGNPLR